MKQKNTKKNKETDFDFEYTESNLTRKDIIENE